MSDYLVLALDYIVNMLPGVILAALLFPILYPVRKKRLTAGGLSSPLPREILLALFWMFCGGMAVLTLVPTGFDWFTALSWKSSFFSLGSVNLIPFRTFTFEGYGFFIWLGNIVMFLPFGLLSAAVWQNFRWKRSILLGVCITGFIECFQIFVGRSFDIDDLILNTFGVLCGYWLWLLICRCFPSLQSHLELSSI